MLVNENYMYMCDPTLTVNADLCRLDVGLLRQVDLANSVKLVFDRLRDRAVPSCSC